jgi:hypothetical protein
VKEQQQEVNAPEAGFSSNLRIAQSCHPEQPHTLSYWLEHDDAGVQPRDICYRWKAGRCCRAGHLDVPNKVSYDSTFFFVSRDAWLELDTELFFSIATNQDMRARFARYYPQVGDKRASICVSSVKGNSTDGVAWSRAKILHCIETHCYSTLTNTGRLYQKRHGKSKSARRRS